MKFTTFYISFNKEVNGFLSTSYRKKFMLTVGFHAHKLQELIN